METLNIVGKQSTASLSRRSRAYARVDPGWRQGLAALRRRQRVKQRNGAGLPPNIADLGLAKAVQSVAGLARDWSSIAGTNLTRDWFKDVTASLDPWPELHERLADVSKDLSDIKPIGALDLDPSMGVVLPPQPATWEGQAAQTEAIHQLTDVMERIAEAGEERDKENRQQNARQMRWLKASVIIGALALMVGVVSLIVALAV